MKTRLLIAMLLLVATPTFAHRDMIILLHEDGTLERLPEQYQPAKLLLKLGAGSLFKKVESMTLEIARRRVTMPRCILELLRVPSRHDIKITSSWYHERGSLAPYMKVEFFAADSRSKAAKRSTALMFNLDTVQLMGVETADYEAYDLSIQYGDIDVTTRCSAEALKGVWETPDEAR